MVAIRHAERASSDRDSELSALGESRARDLARFLADVPLERVYSSDFRRTRDTVGPLRELRPLPLEIYDPSELGALAALIRERGESVVVAGHSNTTPALVRALGGRSPGSPDVLPEVLDESLYDRVYVLRIGARRTETMLYHLPPFDPR